MRGAPRFAAGREVVGPTHVRDERQEVAALGSVDELLQERDEEIRERGALGGAREDGLALGRLVPSEDLERALDLRFVLREAVFPGAPDGGQEKRILGADLQ